MNFRGTITKIPDPPGVDFDRWRQVIAAHPNLQPVAPKMGLNPFTKEPLLYRPHPGTTWVMVAGSQVGMMSWAEDGTNKIAVDGDSDAVDQIAMQVAAQLGGSYLLGDA